MLLTFAQVDHRPSLHLQIPSRQYGSPGSVDTSYAGPSLWICSKEKLFKIVCSHFIEPHVFLMNEQTKVTNELNCMK